VPCCLSLLPLVPFFCFLACRTPFLAAFSGVMASWPLGASPSSSLHGCLALATLLLVPAGTICELLRALSLLASRASPVSIIFSKTFLLLSVALFAYQAFFAIRAFRWCRAFTCAQGCSAILAALCFHPPDAYIILLCPYVPFFFLRSLLFCFPCFPCSPFLSLLSMSDLLP
jgi:hypothetical protein